MQQHIKSFLCYKKNYKWNITFSYTTDKPKRLVYLHLPILFSERELSLSSAIIINIVKAFVALSLWFEAIDALETRLIVHADEEGWESLMIILRIRKGPVIIGNDWTWWLHGRLWLTEGTTIAPNVSDTLQLRKTSADIICQRGWIANQVSSWYGVCVSGKWSSHHLYMASNVPMLMQDIQVASVPISGAEASWRKCKSNLH